MTADTSLERSEHRPATLHMGLCLQVASFPRYVLWYMQSATPTSARYTPMRKSATHRWLTNTPKPCLLFVLWMTTR